MGLSSSMITIIVLIVIAILVLPFILMAMKGGSKNWQNRRMQPYIDEYNKLAQKLNAPPPEIPQHNGYVGWPILRYTNGNANITVTSTTDYKLRYEKEFLYRDPYTNISDINRNYIATGMQAVGILLGTQSRYDDDQQAQQLTLVKMAMPPSLMGSRILITPETIAGLIFSFGEIKTNNSEFDRTFHLTGANHSAILNFLTPDVINALLNFRKKYGKFQLNENEMIWIKTGYRLHDIPQVIDGMVELSRVLWK